MHVPLSLSSYADEEGPKHWPDSRFTRDEGKAARLWADYMLVRFLTINP